MKITEITGDLFTADKDFYFAHCISSDFALGAGIAVEFRNRFNMKNELFTRFPTLRLNDSVIGKALLVDNVFNLVTKKRAFEKPTYISLEESLLDMKQQCLDKDIKKLAMPRIASGLDRLSWKVVFGIIKDVFEDTDIEIQIYSL